MKGWTIEYYHKNKLVEFNTNDVNHAVWKIGCLERWKTPYEVRDYENIK